MTDTTTTLPTGTVEHIDPNLVQFEDNVRDLPDLDKGFIASIRNGGVLLPVLARRGKDGTVYVRDGQLRTLAAREAGLARIPAYFGTTSETKTERITQQLITNDRRTGLNDGERINAFHQLALEGLTATAIARRTGTKKATVEASITIAQSSTASEAIATGQITLDAALALTEFDDDPDLAAQLTQIALKDPDYLPHAAQRARDQRTRHAVVAAAVAELQAAGVVTVTEDDENTGTRLSSLTDDETERTPIGDGAHTGCPGHAILVATGWDREVHTATVCLDPENHGHKPRYTYGTGGQTSSGAQSGPMTDEQKAERRTLIANNKAWASAETVRREWLTTFLSRKNLPKDAGRLIASGLTVHRRDVGVAVTNGNTLAHTLLGIERDTYPGADKIAALVEHTPTKAQHVALAIVLAGIEDSTSRDTWRYPSADKAAYFAQLAAWGYTLSDVEQIVTGTTDGEQAESPASTDDAPNADAAADEPSVE